MSAPERFDTRLLLPLVLGAILNPVNSSIIAVSLVPIGAAFGAPPAETAWLVSSLYLATSIGQPVVGRLVDRYGPRPLFLVGSGLTGLAGVLGMCAPSLPVLVVARVILGFGTCSGYPAAMFLIRREADRTGEDSPSGVLTVLSVASQTIAVIGPPLGGLLIGLGGWRATFAVNIPLALACILLGARRLPRLAPQPRSAHPLAELDLPGIGLFAATLVGLLVFLMEPSAADWWLLALAGLAAAGFAARELRSHQPFLDLRVLGGSRPLLATYLRNLLACTVTYGFLYGFAQWLEDGRGLNPAAAGLVLLPISLAAIGVVALTGRRPEVRAKLLVGAGTQVIACGGLLLLGAASPLWLVVLVALVAGVPQGLNNLANQNALYYQADPDRMGASAGLLRTFTYLGAMIASAAGGAFLGARADSAGMHELATFMLVTAALYLVVTVGDRSLARIGAQ